MNNTPAIQTYFFSCPVGSPEKAAYPHPSIGIAEGLHELGISCYSNINHWEHTPNSNRYLFSHHPDITPADCDIVFLDSEWLDYNYPLPKYVTQRKRNNILVYIDHSDGAITHTFTVEARNFDLILKTSYNNQARGYPSNVVPWCYGLTNRIIHATAHSVPWNKRNRVMLSNFRIRHPIRDRAVRMFYPIINSVFEIDTQTEPFTQPTDPLEKFEWKKTGRRHYQSYYKRMQHAQSIACFGGYYYKRHYSVISKKYEDESHNHSIIRRMKNIFTRVCTPKRDKTVFQWDSYRLWEAFAAGCLVTHLDFDVYGLQLPVMPTNLTHYLGVNFDDIALVKTLVTEADNTVWRIIAENGRTWALTHYSPKALASRLLGLLFLR